MRVGLAHPRGIGSGGASTTSRPALRRGPTRGPRAFTLVEAVVVLILMGILLAVAVSRFRKNGVDLAAESALLRSHLRYAQSRAMADTVPWGVSLATGSYTLIHDGNAAGQLPGDDDHTHTLQGVTISAGTGNLTFDSWGAPSGGALTITLSDGSATRNVTVTANTGFVQ